MTSAQDALTATSVPDLLRAAYALTHHIHDMNGTCGRITQHDSHGRCGGVTFGIPSRSDLRAQRAMIDAELIRRCAA